ncbi:hypothetical protein DWG18_14030 [Lysobacter sp. TY2-98]|uniref:hypothetical protein n=1 Tax=Lysobacter sp. TY2-98 TaxID=2290922 RepID=UPI000E202099|nr:hypothetical protein [Lysobacter sp. TY2-98]AXK73286.1 hypothetical protein DWG18_14030 [Lysobacter sp. TY2-98]
MPFNLSPRAEWVRLSVPVAVLLGSVAACSVMQPADAGVAHVCRPGNADAWIGRAASAAIVDEARVASGSRSTRLVMPDREPDDGPRADRLNLYVDNGALITRTQCG